MKVFEITHKYLVADLKFKEAAVYKFHEPNEKGKEYQMRNRRYFSVLNSL